MYSMNLKSDFLLINVTGGSTLQTPLANTDVVINSVSYHIIAFTLSLMEIVQDLHPQSTTTTAG
jgi:hypothetical protein